MTCTVARYVHIVFLIMVSQLLAGGLWAADIPVSLAVDPEIPVKGDDTLLLLQSDEGFPRFKRLPEIEGVEFIRSQPHTAHYTNSSGQRAYQCAYNIRPTREGLIRIPPVEVEVGTDSYTLPEQEFRVRSPSSNVFLRLEYSGSPTPPESVYVGQDVPVSVVLYIAREFASNIGRQFSPHDSRYIPQPNLDNGAIRMLKSSKSESGVPYRVTDEQTTVDGVPYFVFRYSAKIRPKAAGELYGSFRLHIPVLQVRQSGFTTRTTMVHRQITEHMPTIKVKNLPTAPASDAFALGLVGNFDLSLSVDRSVAKVGEDVELILRAVGYGGTEGATVPELSFPGFRVFPPQVTSTSATSDQLEIRWVMVPVGPTVELRPLTFQTFDTVTGIYREKEMTIDLTVLDKEGRTIWPVKKALPTPTTDTDETEAVVPPNLSNVEIRPIRPLGRVTLSGGSPTVAGLLVLAGPLLCLALYLLRRRRDQLAGDPDALRRRRALATRAALAKRLEGATDDELNALLGDDLLPWLVDLHGLPPGATFDDVATQVTDPALAEQLRAAGRSAYMPVSASTIDRGLLARAVRAATLLALCLLLPAAHAQAATEDTPTADPAALYRAGDFTGAAGHYHDWTQTHPTDPVGWYNLGNCHYSVGDYANALACYERAARLAPRDRDVQANLAVTRGKLGIAPTHATSTLAVAAGWRDSLQPREWLLVAAALWIGGWLAWGLALWRRRRFHWVTVVCGILALAAVQAWYAQQHGYWRDGQAVAVANTSLYLLPSAEPGAARGAIVTGGADLAILERRGDTWYRVRMGDDEGWLPSTAVAPIWP